MLAISRSETRELATLAGLPWTDDPTNIELGPLRNRIRLELIPHLEAEFNPAVRRHLAMAARAIFESSPTDPETGEEFNGGWRVPAGVLWAMGQVEAVRAVRPVVRRLRQGYGLDRDEAVRMWKVVLGSARAAELTGGIRIERLGPWVQICRVASSNDQSTYLASP
jgi:tRNA(Ile)-lysidine synthase